MITLASTDLKPVKERTVAPARRCRAPRQQSRSAAHVRKSGSTVDPTDPHRHAQIERGAPDGGSLVAQGVIGEIDASMLFQLQNPDF